jgi:hypothetical protein
MKAMQFDGLSRDLGQVATRRSFFRLVGGAAAMGAGMALASQDTSAGKRRGGKKVTICYQGTSRSVKKSKVSSFRGATRGACPAVDPPIDRGSGAGSGAQQPVACTQWILSGGPNPTDKIVVDDDLVVLHEGKQSYVVKDSDRKASTLDPVLFVAAVGDVLWVYAQDFGSCRGLSPLWLHCVATGQKQLLHPGYSDPRCDYANSFPFVEKYVTIRP